MEMLVLDPQGAAKALSLLCGPVVPLRNLYRAFLWAQEKQDSAFDPRGLRHPKAHSSLPLLGATLAPTVGQEWRGGRQGPWGEVTVG